MTDFSNTLIRASAMGYLFVEPQSKADKEAGNLSKTAQTYLVNTYIKEKYGREKDVIAPAITKGIEAEQQSIEILSRHQNKALFKNQQRLYNEYITGLPDVYEGESIINCSFLWDIKTSFDIWTFLSNVPEKLNSIYFFQIQSYLWLTNCKKGAIAYVLADTPQNIIESEKRKLLYKMNVISEESPEFIEAAAGIEINMIYPDVPISEKVLIFNIDRDEEIINQMKNKVKKAREFLIAFEEKHMNFNVK